MSYATKLLLFVVLTEEALRPPPALGLDGVEVVFSAMNVVAAAQEGERNSWEKFSRSPRFIYIMQLIDLAIFKY